MGEIMEVRADLTPLPAKAVVEMEQMRMAMQAMAAMLKATTESMDQLRLQVRLLEKVTAAQAAIVNRAIRDRAVEICAMYSIRDDAAVKKAATAIRRTVRLQFGAVKEIPRCEFEVALEQVRGWDDYKVMKSLKEGHR